MSMGMMMLPPVFISLPFKILLFVLVDGWNLVTPVARPELPLRWTRTSSSASPWRRWSSRSRSRLPLLLVGLVVGLVICVFQAVTQIQEQTLTFIPKILATAAVLVVGGPVDARPAPRPTPQELWTVDPGRSSAP